MVKRYFFALAIACLFSSALTLTPLAANQNGFGAPHGETPYADAPTFSPGSGHGFVDHGDNPNVGGIDGQIKP